MEKWRRFSFSAQSKANDYKTVPKGEEHEKGKSGLYSILGVVRRNELPRIDRRPGSLSGKAGDHHRRLHARWDHGRDGPSHRRSSEEIFSPTHSRNQPAGGGGSIGAAETIQAKPDGYTVGLSNQETLTFLPHRSKLPYQSPEDYTSIITLVINNVLIAVKSTSPRENIREFMAYARANPGKVRVASSGIGTTQHVNLEQLRAAAKVNLHHVPFAGAAEVIPALLGGHVEAMVSHPGNTLPYHQPGKVRVLAVFEKKRNPLFPDAPTFREIGYDLIHETCYVIFGPKGIPPKTLSTLHDALKKGMEDPVFIKPMETKGFIVFYEGPQELKNRLMRDYEINAKFAADLLKTEGK